ncbi:T9SS C-terminal target domain-containing protein [Dysgonomonas sp. 216]|uniref:rhamnogalacturonan lyase family protein n=1 Tax=Dysgonomonas sp. 216 TaxID=2302934 RepID=UPI0013D7E755|nr:autotransporter-associated beta strand repeat-containing protein [Dysgonomonas sp. 216]NDW19123.1 T9SS C-terminal target domain-containing protein [Dysgonomonas sp. 216]
MKKIALILSLIFITGNLVYAQRKMEKLDRGVVAIHKGNNNVFISWRLLATDPDDIAFNVYRQRGAQAAEKLNSVPVTNSTNMVVQLSLLNSSSRVFVKPVINNIEGEEEGTWTIPGNPGAHRIVQDYTFEPIPDVAADYTMKFCWPADLDGDGKYDFVLDRQSYGSTGESEEDVNDVNYLTPYVEAYSHAGKFKWRISMGPNVKICNGHNDMVVAYDMDGDGKAEVLMKTSEGTTFADGTVITGANGQVKDYRKTNEVAPHYISIVNGNTGVEIDRIEMPNKDMFEKELYGDWNYKQLNGHFAIAYLDGINPSLVFEQTNRNKDKSFNYMITAWDYKDGRLVERWNWVDREYRYSHFHQIRVADVDGDGCDEIIEGSWVLDHDGTPLFNTDLVHGDRHRTADIDPDRPGLETFAIQQDNPNTLGMALYDAATGEMIKRWYQSSVGDVGRGECMDMDNASRGLEMYSTMHGYYDCKGNILSDKSTLQPAEGIWWDGDLSREKLSPIGKEGFNLAINKWNSATKGFERELPNLYNEKSAYYTKAEWGGRPAFFGDILGDWREELIVMRRDASGFCVISNWAESDHRLYCLMQNPGYRMQTTTRGYYQSPFTDYYLASDMPAPPIAPVQSADVYFTEGTTLTNTTIDGKSVMFDLRNPDTNITLTGNLSPSRIWMINPKGKDYVFSGTGVLSGNMDFVKTQQGTFTLTGNHVYTGNTRISEGRFVLNGSLLSKVIVDARGIIGGIAELKGGIDLNEGLNYMGGRIEPGNGGTAEGLGNITVQGSINGKGRNCFAFDIVPESSAVNDKIVVNGDFNVTGSNNTLDVTFASPKPVAGEYTLITFTGTTNATADNFEVRGLTNTPYKIKVEEHAIILEVVATRAAQQIVWSGTESSDWNFISNNFKLNNVDVFFVPDDEVTFNDEAQNKNVVLTASMPASKVIFDTNSNYTVSGSGAISGDALLTKTGTGTVTINNISNTYTGVTSIVGGTLEAVNIGYSGEASSLGAGSSVDISNGRLRLTGISATDRVMLMEGNVELEMKGSSSSLMLANAVDGTNADFVKTGSGLVNLQGSNIFKSVTLKAGTIFLGSIIGNRYGLGNSTLTMEGGTLRLLDINDMSNTFDSPFNIHIPEGKTARIDGSSRWRMTGKLTGGGTLNFAIPYVRLDLRGNWSEFTGQINIINGSRGGDFRIDNTYGYTNATFNLQAGASVYPLSTGRIVKIGALSGVADSKLSGNSTTWQIGGNNASSFTYNGVIEGTSSKLIKEGTGTLTLTGSNTYTGGTQVNAGTLVVKSISGSATGTGTVTVKSGAALSGSGTVGGSVTVEANGYLNLNDSKLGEFNIGNNLILKSTSNLLVDMNPLALTTDVINAKIVTLSGTLTINNMGATSFADGMEFKIFNASTGAQGKFEKVLPELDGLIWDQSRITEGIIIVKSGSSIFDNTTSGKLSMYPNPVKDILTIDMEGYKGDVTVSFLSIDGKLLKLAEKESDGILKLDVSWLDQGNYIVVLDWDNRTYRNRITK